MANYGKLGKIFNHAPHLVHMWFYAREYGNNNSSYRLMTLK